MILFSIIMLQGIDTYIFWFENLVPHLDNFGGKGYSPLNQSITAFWGRLASQGYFNLDVYPTLGALSGLLIVILSFGICSFTPLSSDDTSFDLEFSLITILVVIFPSFVLTAQYTMILGSYLLLFLYIMDRPISLSLYICMGLSYTLVSFGAFGGQSFASGILILFQSPKLFGILILWAIHFYFLYQHRFSKTTA